MKSASLWNVFWIINTLRAAYETGKTLPVRPLALPVQTDLG